SAPGGSEGRRGFRSFQLSIVTGREYATISKRLPDDHDHDNDHEQRRDFVPPFVEARRTDVAPIGEILAPERVDVVEDGHEDDSRRLDVDPAPRPIDTGFGRIHE